MDKFSSEATKAGFQEPEKPVSEMTEEELKRFRASFDPDCQPGLDTCMLWMLQLRSGNRTS